MKELKCPKCGNVFSVDEADYALLLNQVKGAEFDAEIKRRLAELHHQQEAEEQLRMAKADQLHQNELSQKEKAIMEKENEIVRLKNQIASLDDRKQLELTQAVSAKDKEISDLKNNVELAAMQASLREKSIREEYETKLKLAQEQVDYYKDLKAKMSTKMVGETLETHCSTIFNGEMRPMFPNAYFEKDNDASGGSKGDFIFRDYDGETEYISIMFEMKNEMDETATKHKNEDFFKKLDADRNAKGCEYAVLVSLLEPESELYNGGIVDVSYRYPKMYVIRPQFFKAMITLLVNAANKTVDYQRQLAIARSQSIDVTNFENKLLAFRDKFGKHYTNSSEKLKNAIEQIDATIKKLEGVKKSLQLSDDYLRMANKDTDELTIKKLTYKNPTMKAMFEEAKD